jgi:hypothetical protein
MIYVSAILTIAFISLCSSSLDWLFWRRRYNAMQAKLRFLEQREDELTAAVSVILEKVANLEETNAEMSRLIPQMRTTLIAFQKFNELY